MPDRFVASHVGRLPLFQGLTPPQLDLLTDAFRVMRFEVGEIVFRQGEAAQGMYLFVDGEGVLLQLVPGGGMQQVGIVTENQFFNEHTLFTPTPESATLQITRTAIVLFLARETFLSLLGIHPEIRANLRVPEPALEPPTASQVAAPVFKGQRPNETVLISTRRHPFAYVRQVWLAAVVGVILIVASLLVESSGLRLGMIVLALLVPGAIMVYFYFEWTDDLLIVTDHRVLRIENQLLTFSNTVSEIPLKSVQEVYSEIPPVDPFARLFRYGTVLIKTPGDAGNIKVDLVPNPQAIQDYVFRQRTTNAQVDDGLQQRNAIRAEIDKLLDPNAAAPPGLPNRSVPTPGLPNPSVPDPARPQTVLNRAPAGARGTRFINAEGDTVYRKHRFIWLQRVLPPALLILVAVGLLFFGLISPALREAFGVGVVLAAIMLVTFGGVWLLWADWDWRNDLYIIGDETIRLIHRRPLWMQNEIDQILINRVDNVVSDVNGFLRNILGFGDVRVSLVGDEIPKVFRNVPNPGEIQGEISRRQERVRQIAQEQSERQRRDEIAQYLSVYHEAVRERERQGMPTYDYGHPPPAPTPSPPSQPPVPRQRAAPPPPYLPNNPPPQQDNNVPPVRDQQRPPNIPRIRRTGL